MNKSYLYNDNFISYLKFLIKKILRIKDISIMMILFHIWPEQTFRFSTKKCLPSKKTRNSKKLMNPIPFDLLESKSSKIEKMKEINIVGLGPSFNLNELKNTNLPTFLISFWNPLKIDEAGNIIYSSEEGGFGHAKQISNNKNNGINFKELKKENIIYVHSRENQCKKFMENGHKVFALHVYRKDRNNKLFPVREEFQSQSFFDIIDNDKLKRISIEDKIYKTPILPPQSHVIPSGSFLPSFAGLSFFAEKINVYGWDFFLESSPENMSYWQVFFNMYKSNADSYRSGRHFEEALINYYYAYHLFKLPNVKIHGYLGKLSRHTKLIKRIERVLFN